MMKLDVTRWLAAFGTILLLLPDTAARGSVYDDASAWWHFDFASSGTAGAANEIRDQRFWETAGGRTATSVLRDPQWTTGLPATGPAGGQSYGGRGLTLTPAVTGGGVEGDGFAVSNFSMAGSSSLLMRINWAGYPDAQQTAWIYSNGFDYGADQGYLFGLSGVNGSPTLLWGQNAVSASWTTNVNTWYDLGVVIDDANNQVTFHRWAAGGAYESQTIGAAFINGLVGNTTTQVGYEDAGVNFGNASKSFSGTFDHLAAWNRTLSVAEVHDAFGAPNNEWQIGIENGSVEDIRFESAVDANYTIGDPWHEMPRAVTQGYSANNVTFSLSAAEADLNHVFHLDVQGTSGGAKSIKVVVNGNDLGTQTVNSGDDPQWIINRQFLNAGNNLLKIEQVGFGGGEYIAWDWLEMGGAWQVGADDGSQSDFGSEHSTPTDFYVTNPNLAQVERAIASQDADDLDNLVRLNFNLSDTLADLDYLFKTEVIQQSQIGGNPFDVLVNGSLLQSFAAQPDGTTIAVYISGSLLVPGNNSIALAFSGTSGNYTQFDYFQLQVVPEPTALGLALLAAIAIGRVRRRRG